MQGNNNDINITYGQQLNGGIGNNELKLITQHLVFNEPQLGVITTLLKKDGDLRMALNQPTLSGILYN